MKNPISVSKKVVVLDNDPLILLFWRLAAKKAQVELVCFDSPAEFFKQIAPLDRSVPLYIDFDLGRDSVRGDEISKTANALGFKFIYLMTGFSKQDLPSFPWIKDIVGKEPPF